MHFAGYERVPGVLGTELDPPRIAWHTVAKQLGRFLSAVHAFPVADADRLGVVTTDIESHFEEVRVTSLQLLPGVREAAPGVQIERLRRYLEELRPLPAPPWPMALVHQDLAAEHVLLAPDGSGVTGVIDWGDVAIADPTVDFVGLHAWRGDDFVRDVLRHYDGPVDERVLERVRPWSRFRVIQDIEFGVRNDLPGIVRLAVQSLVAGASDDHDRAL
jgi:aminoglycoside phosphotransferase (APT) family kinase protein